MGAGPMKNLFHDLRDVSWGKVIAAVTTSYLLWGQVKPLVPPKYHDKVDTLLGVATGIVGIFLNPKRAVPDGPPKPSL